MLADYIFHGSAEAEAYAQISQNSAPESLASIFVSPLFTNETTTSILQTVNYFHTKNPS